MSRYRSATAASIQATAKATFDMNARVIIRNDNTDAGTYCIADGIRFLGLGIVPKTPLERVPWMPKNRYRIMREVLEVLEGRGAGVSIAAINGPKQVVISGRGTDVEADGPIPGPNSMLSFASAAYQPDKTLIATFSANLELLPGAAGDPRTLRFAVRLMLACGAGLLLVFAAVLVTQRQRFEHPHGLSFTRGPERSQSQPAPRPSEPVGWAR